MRGKVCPGWKVKAGIARRVRFHDLRHTCASHLVMGTWGQAWSLSEVAAMLGHSRTTTTEIYAHLSPDHLFRKAAQTARDACLSGSELPRLAAELSPRVGSQGSELDLYSPTARPAGIEPATLGLEGRCSIRLSYERSKAQNSSRRIGEGCFSCGFVVAGALELRAAAGVSAGRSSRNGGPATIEGRGATCEA